MRVVDRYLVPLALAPGIVVHELAHALACVLLRVPVQDVVLFSFGPRAGYVEHAVPRSYAKRIVIATAPLAVNTAVAVVAFLQSASLAVPYALLAGYLGVVAVATSIPSSVDARSLYPHTRRGYLHPLFYLALPLIAVLLLVNRLRPFGVHTAYTLAVSGLLLALFHTDGVGTGDVAGAFEGLLAVA